MTDEERVGGWPDPKYGLEKLASSCEQLVLGLCAKYKSIYDEYIKKGLNLEYFTKFDNVEIFKSIMKSRAQHDVRDIHIPGLELDSKLKNKLLDYQVESEIEHAKEYFDKLEQAFLKRRMTDILKNTSPTREGVSEAAIVLASLAEAGGEQELSLLDMIDNTIELVESRSDAKYTNRYRSGLDIESLGHYEPGTLVTLGGGSGHGKSTLTLNLIHQWLQRGLSVVYFSNEMIHEYVLVKLNCIKTGQSWTKVMHLKNLFMDMDEKDEFVNHLKDVATHNFRIYERPKTIPEMRLIIKAHKPDVFVLDTINKLIPSNKERTDIALGNIARDLKFLAQETDSLAIIVAQLRDIYGRPTDKNLIKESRQIRDESDYMDFIYRESEHVNADDKLNTVFEVYRVKGRLTGIGRCFLRIDLDNGQITNFSSKQKEKLDEYFEKNKRRLFKDG